VFKSRSTNKWKVAVSAPVFREKEFMGILALTVSLGDFEFFRSENSRQRNRFAVLVDGREGADTGTILQHPLFDELLAEYRSLPEVLFEPRYRVPRDLLTGEKREYDDPLGKFQGVGSDAQQLKQRELANAYERRWVAASSQVRSPARAGGNHESGLIVLVQSDYGGVVGPARHLGDQFIRNNMWMLAVVVVVSLSLWYIVVRMFREPRARLGRSISAAQGSTPLHGMSTLAAPTKQLGE
jgi:hypothetical protein